MIPALLLASFWHPFSCFSRTELLNGFWMVFLSILNDLDPKNGHLGLRLLVDFSIFVRPCSARVSCEGSLACFGTLFDSILVASRTFGVPLWYWNLLSAPESVKHQQTAADTSRRKFFPFLCSERNTWLINKNTADVVFKNSRGVAKVVFRLSCQASSQGRV